MQFNLVFKLAKIAGNCLNGLVVYCFFFRSNLVVSPKMGTWGEPAKLRDDILPTGHDIYKHYRYLNIERVRSGEWNQNTSLFEKVKCVRSEVADIWDRTGIPHTLSGKCKEGDRQVTTIVIKGRKLSKVVMNKRGDDFGQELNVLFDVALCPHTEKEVCSCKLQDKVVILFLDN